MGRRLLGVVRSTAGWCAIAVGALCGCQRDGGAVAPRRPGPPIVTVNGQEVSPEGKVVTPPAGSTAQPLERVLKSDPCATRLHEISGAMLTYQAVRGRMPASLEDLQTVQGVTEGPLQLTCPASGEAYVYVPDGLRSAEDARQIVVHDRSADASGFRWVILMQPPRGRQAAATWVMKLGEPAFRAYVPAPGAARGSATKASERR
jgi:hypothetical protein